MVLASVFIDVFVLWHSLFSIKAGTVERINLEDSVLWIQGHICTVNLRHRTKANVWLCVLWFDPGPRFNPLRESAATDPQESNSNGVFIAKQIHFIFFYFFTACEKEIAVVCKNSSEEHLQPFKEKMETFVQNGE